MKQITVISGKGGTGKTSLVSAFAQLASPCVAADCDVDAANLRLILKPQVELEDKHPFYSGYKAVVSEASCIGCGACEEYCRFEAASLVGKLPKIDTVLCEGCGVCVDVCPRGCVTLEENRAGEYYVDESRFGPLVHGRLGIAQAASGKLVTLIRRKAESLAESQGFGLVINDGSPGIGCPVIASISGVDASVIVTEPTVSGAHDLARMLEVCRHFGIAPYVVINKCDLNPGMAQVIEELSAKAEAPVLGRINFDPVFSRAIDAEKTVLEFGPDQQPVKQISSVWHELIARLQ